MADDTEKADRSSAFWDLLRTCYEIDHLPASHPDWQEVRSAMSDSDGELRDPAGNTAFMVALWAGKDDTASALFDMGSDPAAVNDRGLCVFQSLARDVGRRKKNIDRFVSVIERFPHQWSRPSDPSEFDRVLDSWVEPLLSLNRSWVDSPSSLGKLLDYVFAPLSYEEAARLTRRHAPSEGTVGDSIEWKSRLAEKASQALSAVAGRAREETSATPPRM